MELLISAGVTLLVQLFKKVGGEKAKDYVLIIAFVLSIVCTLLWKAFLGELDWTNYEQVISVMGVAIGYYELVVKRLIVPVFNKLKK